MTVAELIAVLEKLPPEAEVVACFHPAHHLNESPVRQVYMREDGKVEIDE